MKNNIVTVALIFATVASLSFGAYQYRRSSNLLNETAEWKIKYEEALIDMEEANKRIETIREQLEVALKDSETHRINAEVALLELQKHKAKK